MTLVYDTDISPPAQTHHLLRTELIQQIQNTPKKLTLIQAPPGYGKTSLLNQIWQQSAPPSIWLNLREADNDPVNFIHKMNAALLTRHAQAAELAAHQQLGGMAPPSFVPWLKSLCATLNREGTCSVFLNDVDFLTNTATLELVEHLIQHTRPSVRFFVTATQSIPFSYSSLLIENQVASLNHTTLRFDPAEVAQYFQQVSGLALPPKLIHQLTNQCEGWPAAIAFGAHTLKTEQEVKTHIAELGTMHSTFDRYFVERIFEKQTPAIQRLMLRLSLLDRFSIELSAQLCESPEDNQVFAAYIHNHTFITPTDASGHWLRFHTLFNQFLRSRCQQSLTEEERRMCLSTAAFWFADRHFIEDAISLMIAAGCREEAARWMEEAFPNLVVALGKHVTYGNWFQALGEHAIEKFPRARIGYIWSLTARRQYMLVAKEIMWLHKHKCQYDLPVQHEIERVTDLIHCAMKGLQDDATTGIPQVTEWLSRWNDVNCYRNQEDYHYEVGLALVLKGFFAKCLSRFAEAREALIQSLDHFQAYGTWYGQTWARSLLAVTFAKQGFHHEAQQEAEEGYRLAQRYLGENSHSGYGLAALLAAIHYEHDELELAGHYLTDCLDSLKEQSATDLLCAAYETQTRLFMARQSHEEGLGFLKDGIKWAEVQRLNRLKMKLVDELIVWLVRLDRGYEAEIYASQYDLILPAFDNFDLNDVHHKIAGRSLVYQFWQRQDMHNAEQLLNKLVAASEQAGQIRKTALYRSLLAINAHKQARAAEAQTALLQAIQTASSQRYYRLFMDEPQLTALIHELLRQTKGQSPTPEHAFLKRLSDKLPVPVPEKSGETISTLVEPLTSKETEIIQLLASGLANKKIAEKLFISEGTLKWHLHNIYSKLQVKNRTQALIEGRKQGYL